MKQRCLNHKHARFADYGGRGITVCDRWLEFKNFVADMGERPDNRSLDRIDNDGPYVATGDRIVLLRGERRIFGDNIRLQGPPIRDLGFEKDKPVQAPAALPRPTSKP